MTASSVTSSTSVSRRRSRGRRVVARSGGTIPVRAAAARPGRPRATDGATVHRGTGSDDAQAGGEVEPVDDVRVVECDGVDHQRDEDVPVGHVGVEAHRFESPRARRARASTGPRARRGRRSRRPPGPRHRRWRGGPGPRDGARRRVATAGRRSLADSVRGRPRTSPIGCRSTPYGVRYRFRTAYGISSARPEEVHCLHRRPSTPPISPTVTPSRSGPARPPVPTRRPFDFRGRSATATSDKTLVPTDVARTVVDVDDLPATGSPSITAWRAVRDDPTGTHPLPAAAHAPSSTPSATPSCPPTTPAEPSRRPPRSRRGSPDDSPPTCGPISCAARPGWTRCAPTAAASPPTRWASARRCSRSPTSPSPSRGPFLVVGPTGLVSNWIRELRRWAPDALHAVDYRGGVLPASTTTFRRSW